MDEKKPANDIVERGAIDYAKKAAIEVWPPWGELGPLRGVSMNRFEDFLTVDGNFLRATIPRRNLVPADFHDGHNDVIVDDDGLVFFSGQY